MRVEKRAVVAEAKKPTRTAITRLGKASESPPSRKTGNNTITLRSTPAPPQEEKKLRGPLKKRPITEAPKVVTPIAATPKSKEKIKDSQKASLVSMSASVSTLKEEYETPPTIAAGRSRRAIKPNPKYACEDMVTPKIIKHVGSLGQSSSVAPSTQKRQGGSGGRDRFLSTSSSEDFFNKESSDELDDYGVEDDVVDKAFQMDEKLDSDFSDLEVQTPTLPRKRGRPRKVDSVSVASARTPKSAASVTSANKSLSTIKSTPSQLQQLRKTLATNVNRLTSVSVSGVKRKIESTPALESGKIITSKRLRLVPISASKQLSLNELSPEQKSSTDKDVTSQVLNGDKVLTVSAVGKEVDKRRSLPVQMPSIISKNNTKALISRQSPLVLSKSSSSAGASAGGKVMVAMKQRSASPATPKTTAATKVQQQQLSAKSEEKKGENSTAAPTEDAEGMPTFTIVNINDIINKKGDALISKTGQRVGNIKTTKLFGGRTSASPSAEKRRPTTSILSEKIDAEHVNVAQQRSSFLAKKSTQVLLNKSGGLTPSKPAPRILNSMVAKKTQPVKPMIANLDDSADESFPLSLDDEVELDDDENSVGTDPETSLSPYLTMKKNAPATKENTSAVTNRLSAKSFSPEKVVISRQGDKIIKKITCFEMWYVINIPPDRAPKVLRNQLEIPLIKLANASKRINLPSSSWSSKVTLYELPAATLAKTTPIMYSGDLGEHNISEEDRGKYQPLCVMFRRAVSDRQQSRLPYDRAVIFKNKTFFTNIEGKNVKLEGAPTVISTQNEVEILLQIVDGLTLQSDLVEPATTMQ